MGKVTAGLTMSLDGFIAGPNDGPSILWAREECGSSIGIRVADTDYVVPTGGMTFKVSSQAADLCGKYSGIGAIVTGRRTFDITNGWGGTHPIGQHVPIFVVTLRPRRMGLRGVAIHLRYRRRGDRGRTGQEPAGEKNVAVGAASLVQQCLKARLLDEVHADVVPVLLGDGVRLSITSDRTNRAGEDRVDSRSRRDPHVPSE